MGKSRKKWEKVANVAKSREKVSEVEKMRKSAKSAQKGENVLQKLNKNVQKVPRSEGSFWVGKFHGQKSSSA